MHLTFRTERGSFTLASDLFEDGREHDLARAWARGTPDGGGATVAGKERLPDGSVRIRWRLIHVIARPA